MPPGLTTRVRRALPTGPARILIVNAVVGTFGSGLFLAGSVMYFTRGIGLAAWQVALGISIAGGAGLLASVPLATLADRYGYRRFVVTLHLVRAVAYLSYLWVDDFAGFLVVVCTVSIADKASYPLTQAMVGDLFEGHARTRTMAMMRAMQNIGMSAGALVAAAVLTADLESGFHLLTAANGLSFVFTAVQLSRLPATPPARTAGGVPETPGRVLKTSRWRLLWISGLNGVLSLHDTILFVALPLWIAADKDASPALVSVVLAINTVLTAVSQVWWTRFTRTIGRAAWAAVSAGVMLALCCLVMALTGMVSSTYATLLVCVAAIALTVGENLQAAAAWEISFALSPDRARGAHLATFELGVSAGDVLGPALVTAAVIGLGPYGWALLAAALTLGGTEFRRSALRLVERQLLQRDSGGGAALPMPSTTH